MLSAGRVRLLPLLSEVLLLHRRLLDLHQVEVDIVGPLAPPDGVDEVALLARLAIRGLKCGVALSRSQLLPDDVSLRLCCQPLAVLATWLQIHHVLEVRAEAILVYPETLWYDWRLLVDLRKLRLGLAMDHLHRRIFIRYRLHYLSLSLQGSHSESSTLTSLASAALSVLQVGQLRVEPRQFHDAAESVGREHFLQGRPLNTL